MKVNGPRNASGASGARRPAGASAAPGFAPIGPAASASAASAIAPLSAPSALGGIDALLALQGEPDQPSARKQATDRAFSLLDILDDLKLALIEGRLPRATLARLMDTLKASRESTHDPRLEALLNEVEVRAAVELAKHEC